MKRTALILALFLSLSLLCACTETPPATTTPPLPTETTEPTETAPVLFCPGKEASSFTVPSIEFTEQYEFEDYYTLLEYTYPEHNWLLNAMGCVFSKPEEIDLNFMFYGGFADGSWDRVSEESTAYLIDQGFWREMDLQPMSREKLDQTLQSTFGVSLDDMTIPEEWVYVETEDLYCSNHNDVYMVEDFTITNVTEYTDGTVGIHYFCENYYSTADDDFLYTVDLILTLRETENGYQAVSNVLVGQNAYDALYDRELIDIISTEEALAVWAASEDPGSDEALENLAALSPAFAELMTRASALDTFAWYGPERIAELNTDPETIHNAEHLALLIVSVRAP